MGYICNKILHYRLFLPCGFLPYAAPRLCSIVSDEDGDISTRDLDIEDFLDNAKRLATDHNMILMPLLKHTRRRVGKMTYNPPSEEPQLHKDETEAMESLCDLFDAARQAEKQIEGEISVREETSGNGHDASRTRTVSYNELLAKLFSSWGRFPVGSQFEAVEGMGRVLDFQAYYGDSRRSWLRLTACDMMQFLDSAGEQWK